MTDRELLDIRFPGAARDAKTQKAPAIRLHCIECMGGNLKDASTCATTECRLWPHAYKRARRDALQARRDALETVISPSTAHGT